MEPWGYRWAEAGGRVREGSEARRLKIYYLLPDKMAPSSFQVQFYVFLPFLLLALRPKAPGFLTRFVAASSTITVAVNQLTGLSW